MLLSVFYRGEKNQSPHKSPRLQSWQNVRITFSLPQYSTVKGFHLYLLGKTYTYIKRATLTIPQTGSVQNWILSISLTGIGAHTVNIEITCYELEKRSS